VHLPLKHLFFYLILFTHLNPTAKSIQLAGSPFL
jgi:hypothetical protein